MTVIPFPDRRLPNRPVEIRARILRADGAPLPCTLLDLTWKGALINTSKLILPDAFTLMLNGQNNGSRRCRVLWRERDVVSVEFESLA